jgi:hypothetical protein
VVCGRTADMKSGTRGRSARNPAEIEFPVVPTAPGTNGAAAGAPPPDGALVTSGFSTAAIHRHRSTT